MKKIKHLTLKEIAEHLEKNFVKRKCVICGEEKICTNYSEYAWKIESKFCCSYHCFRILEKQYLESPKRKYNTKKR